MSSLPSLRLLNALCTVNLHPVPKEICCSLVLVKCSSSSFLEAELLLIRFYNCSNVKLKLINYSCGNDRPSNHNSFKKLHSGNSLPLFKWGEWGLQKLAKSGEDVKLSIKMRGLAKNGVGGGGGGVVKKKESLIF